MGAKGALDPGIRILLEGMSLLNGLLLLARKWLSVSPSWDGSALTATIAIADAIRNKKKRQIGEE